MSAPTFDHEAAIAAVRDGQSLTAVGKQHGVSRERIRQIVRRAGIAPALGLDLLKRARAAVPAMVREGLPDKLIAEELGVSIACVAGARRAAGLSERDWRTRFAEALRQHLAAGKSIRAFCIERSQCEATAQQVAHELDLPITHGRWRDLSDRQDVIKRMRAAGASWATIARKMAARDGRSYSAASIYNWTRTHAPHLVGARAAPRTAGA